MAKVIEFYVPQRFRNSLVRSGRRQPGKVIEFCSPARKSARTQLSGEVIDWLLVTKKSSHAVSGDTVLF